MTNLFDVSERHVLITGGTRGLGRMIAEGFIRAGARVYLASRTPEDCAEIASVLGQGAEPVPADISTLEGCRGLADDVSALTDRLDVLVNNAGSSWGANIEEYPDSGWDKVLAVNLKAPFHLTVAVLDLLRAAATPERPARVINIGSIDGLQVPIWESYAYSSSKAGLHQLTRHVGKRLASEHITVNAIAPGIFKSDMTSFAFEANAESLIDAIPMGRSGVASDVAGAAIYLASPAASWVTGTVLIVDGGLHTLK